MGSIFGQCPRCPKNSPTRRLYGGFCSFHLDNQIDDQSKQKVAKDLKLIEDTRLVKKWFADQLLAAPARCENCGEKISIPASLPAKTKVCHILPKKNFDSVKTHELNRWFGCWQCHKDFDSTWARAVNMPVWSVCVERFKKFMMQIKMSEYKFLPDQLAEILHDPKNL